MKDAKLSRRSFLKSLGGATALASFPSILTAANIASSNSYRDMFDWSDNLFADTFS
jgi:hypothetical protein